MNTSSSHAPRPTVDPPFSPVLIAGLAAAPLPIFVVQSVVTTLMRFFIRRYPGIWDRMQPYSHAVIGIDPVDLPFSLTLAFDQKGPTLSVARNLPPSDALTAIIRGSLDILLALAEGRMDGDTVFFSRKLAIEGDTEVILALRNAIDDADIDLARDIDTVLGPLSPRLRPVRRGFGRVIGHISTEINRLHQALVGPIVRDLERQTARIAVLEAAQAPSHPSHTRKGVKL